LTDYADRGRRFMVTAMMKHLQHLPDVLFGMSGRAARDNVRLGNSLRLFFSENLPDNIAWP
jgi:hypothetical protein